MAYTPSQMLTALQTVIAALPAGTAGPWTCLVAEDPKIDAIADRTAILWAQGCMRAQITTDRTWYRMQVLIGLWHRDRHLQTGLDRALDDDRILAEALHEWPNSDFDIRDAVMTPGMVGVPLPGARGLLYSSREALVTWRAPV